MLRKLVAGVQPRLGTAALMGTQRAYSTQGLASLVIKAHEGDQVKTISVDVTSGDTVEGVKRRLHEQHGE